MSELKALEVRTVWLNSLFHRSMPS